MAARKPILISGAGLSSLLLGQSLRRAGIPFQVFERDGSMSFRAQGYRLRLSADGLDAIESVLGPEGFKKFWDACGKTGGGGVAALDAITGEKLNDEAPPPPNGNGGVEKQGDNTVEKKLKETLHSREGKVLGIARGEMRRLFMEGCEEFVTWSHHVTGYELTPTGVKAIFADGTKSIEGAMLIGGEGIYSKVAKQLSGGKLKVYDTGARGIHGQAPTTAFKQLGEGVFRLVDDSRDNGRVFIITNVRSGDMDNPDVNFGWTMMAQPGGITPPNNDFSVIGAPAANMAKELTKNWHPRFQPLLEQMDVSEAAFWKITCSTPSGVPQWENQPRVTVIGDAVHSMTPAGGIGANTAVRDSALLGKLLTEAGGYKEGITEAYEKEMRVYGSEAVAMSYGLAMRQFRVAIDDNSQTL